MAVNQIKISPYFHPWYYEYYLQGIHEFYGQDFTVQFCFEERFLAFREQFNTSYSKDFFYYEVHQQDRPVKKVLISADDMLQVNEAWYNEVDVYAKVNINNDLLNRFPKLFPIGPNFGIRHLSRWKYYLLSWQIWRATGSKNPYWSAFHNLSLKRLFFSDYRQLKATPKPTLQTQKPFVFYLNYPWQKHKALTQARKEIIEVFQRMAAKQLINFEGGFSRRRLGPFKGLEKWSASRLYSLRQYLTKVHQSSFVFNTPAVHGCLGWKLGEYFALGKAVISTPYDRVIPAAMLEDLVITVPADNAFLQHEIEQILENTSGELAQKAAKAQEYFEAYLAPKKVIERIHLQKSGRV
ncbi:MAG: hypothetical protein EAY72_00490 [Bacteroidetes bacterium]|nr:MAG: hypothetical protein EAY72_00490 [Bacteroidota bacterium]